MARSAARRAEWRHGGAVAGWRHAAGRLRAARRAAWLRRRASATAGYGRASAPAATRAFCAAHGTVYSSDDGRGDEDDDNVGNGGNDGDSGDFRCRGRVAACWKGGCYV